MTRKRKRKIVARKINQKTTTRTKRIPTKSKRKKSSSRKETKRGINFKKTFTKSIINVANEIQ